KGALVRLERLVCVAHRIVNKSDLAQRSRLERRHPQRSKRSDSAAEIFDCLFVVAERMAQPAELNPSLGSTPLLPIAVEQLQCVFDIRKSLALVSHFKVDAADLPEHDCLRSLVSDSLCNHFGVFVRIEGGLGVAGLAIDVADSDNCLTLDSEIVCLLCQRPRFGEQSERLLGLAHIFVEETE